jgi:hypothetical protein
MNSGQPLGVYAPRSPMLTEIDVLIKQLEPETVPRPPKSILSRLGRALSST